MIRNRRFLTTLATMTLLVAGCAQAEEPTATETTPTAEPSPALTPLSTGEEAVFHGIEDVAGKSEIELEVDDLYFEPTVLRGDAGQELTLTMFNEGKELHNITLSDQAIDTDINAGQENVQVRVKFPASGGLVFFCKYHSDTGMRGELLTV